MTNTVPYPAWVCFDCGELYGRREAGLCTIHEGMCDVCGDTKAVTEPRDFGHLKPAWKQNMRKTVSNRRTK